MLRVCKTKCLNLSYFLSEINVEFSSIVIFETWFQRDSFLGNFTIAGYNLLSASRGNGGGVAV
jgi:hypothetical protein